MCQGDCEIRQEQPKSRGALRLGDSDCSINFSIKNHFQTKMTTSYSFFIEASARKRSKSSRFALVPSLAADCLSPFLTDSGNKSIEPIKNATALNRVNHVESCNQLSGSAPDTSESGRGRSFQDVVSSAPQTCIVETMHSANHERRRSLTFQKLVALTFFRRPKFRVVEIERIGKAALSSPRIA